MFTETNMGVEPSKPSRGFATGQRDSSDACGGVIHWDIQWPAQSYSSRFYWLFARYRASAVYELLSHPDVPSAVRVLA